MPTSPSRGSYTTPRDTIVREHDAGDCHAEIITHGEVRKPLPARRMLLGKEDFPFAAVIDAPGTYPALQRTQRAWRVFLWVTTLEFLEERTSLQLRIGRQQR